MSQKSYKVIVYRYSPVNLNWRGISFQKNLIWVGMGATSKWIVNAFAKGRGGGRKKLLELYRRRIPKKLECIWEGGI